MNGEKRTTRGKLLIVSMTTMLLLNIYAILIMPEAQKQSEEYNKILKPNLIWNNVTMQLEYAQHPSSIKMDKVEQFNTIAFMDMMAFGIFMFWQTIKILERNRNGKDDRGIQEPANS